MCMALVVWQLGNQKYVILWAAQAINLVVNCHVEVGLEL